MKKYTFICEFQGGTYISQYTAESLLKALPLWVGNLDPNVFSENKRKKISKKIYDEFYAPVLLDSIENVWCISFSIYRSLLLLNIIETV